MALTDGRSNQSPDDWGVVIQSVPSKSKKAILKQLVDVFNIDKRYAEQALSSMPLVFLDGLSFGLAVRIKKSFQGLGAVSETTNHEMIKKNCYQIDWPQMPELSHFLKDPEKTPEMNAESNERGAHLTGLPAVQRQPEIEKSLDPVEILNQPAAEQSNPVLANEKQPVLDNANEILNLDKVSLEEDDPEDSRPDAPPAFQSLGDAPPSSEADPSFDRVPVSPVLDAPTVTPVKGEAAPPAEQSVNPSWERRAKELKEKLQKIQDEKQQLVDKHTEITEKVETELRQEIEKEKQKREEISKSFEDLQKKAEKHEEVSREGDAWRERVVSMTEKISGIETELAQKNATLEELTREKNEAFQKLICTNESLTEIEAKLGSASRDLAEALTREKELGRKISEVQSAFEAKASDLASLQERISELEAFGKEARTEISALKEREQNFLKKTESLEQEIGRKNDDLTSRDEMLSQFEKQVLELAAKVAEFEPMRREHAQFLQERTTLRREYEGRITEQEVRLAKLEDEHRRYRSRTDRKNAAATRELGESVRSVDSLRQVLQKLILFLGSEAAVLDTEKKIILKSPLTRGPSSVSP